MKLIYFSFLLFSMILISSCNKSESLDADAFDKELLENTIMPLGLPGQGKTMIGMPNSNGSYDVFYGGAQLHFDYILKNNVFTEGEPTGGYSVSASSGEISQSGDYFIVVPNGFGGTPPNPKIWDDVSKYNKAFEDFINDTTGQLTLPQFTSYFPGPYDGGTPVKGYVIRTNQTESTLAIVPELDRYLDGVNGSLPVLFGGTLERNGVSYSFAGSPNSNKIHSVVGLIPGTRESVNITKFKGTYQPNGPGVYYVEVSITLDTGETFTLDGNV